MFKHSKYIFLIILFIARSSYSQWTQVSQVNNIGSYPSISAANCSTVVIAGGMPISPVVYLSTNGGNNFSNITTSDITRDLYCCWALNKDTIFAGDGGSPGGMGGNARVYRTINGGLNWTIILTTGGNSGFISGIVFERPQQNFGIIVSDPPNGNDSFWIAKTINSGGNWIITKAPFTPLYTTQNSPFVVDSTFYGFGLINASTGPGRIYTTSNGGLNWNIRSFALSSNSVPSVAFQSDKLNGIALSDIMLPNFAATTNGGINWQTYSAGAGTTGVGTVKWVRGTNIYYLCANKIKRTSNSGLTWEEMNTGGILNFVHMDIITNSPADICAYALTEDGKVLKYEGEPFGIKQISTEIPQKFELLQNYPNPFNPITNLRFEISDLRFVKLMIYNILGVEVQTLVSKELKPGTYEVDWDANTQPSGVYFYKLTAGEFSETKKMVLLK